MRGIAIHGCVVLAAVISGLKYPTGNQTSNVHMNAPVITNIRSNSFTVNFVKPMDVKDVIITVAPRHLHESRKVIITDQEVEDFENVTSSTIYRVTVNANNSYGELGQESNATEFRTMPSLEIRLSEPTPTSVIVMFDTDAHMSISEWLIELHNKNDGSKTAKSISRAYGHVFNGLQPDTNYQVRVRVAKMFRNKTLSESETLFTPWKNFTTDTLSIFGSVGYVGYSVEYSIPYSKEWNGTRADLEKAYRELNKYPKDIKDISIVEISKMRDKQNSLVHFRLHITNPDLLTEKENLNIDKIPFFDYFMINEDNVQGTPFMRITDDIITMEYKYNHSTNSSCQKYVEKHLILTPCCKESGKDLFNTTTSGDTPENLKITSSSFSLDGKQVLEETMSDAFGFSFRFLVKDCSNSYMREFYSEYYEATDADNSSNTIKDFIMLKLDIRTDEEREEKFKQLVANGLKYSSLDSTSVEIVIPAIENAIKYEIISSVQMSKRSTGIRQYSYLAAELKEKDIDSSNTVKINVFSMARQHPYSVQVIVTIRKPDASEVGLSSNVFSIYADGEECQFCVAGPYCYRHVGSSVYCGCDDGYVWDGDVSCNDKDECKLEEDDCHDNATCMNTDGSFNCSCKVGFSGTGTYCEDIDECTTNGSDCSLHADCNNTIGSHSCTCKKGFFGDGFICTDVDECEDGSHNCHADANCTNHLGNYSCVCLSGYSGDGEICTDIDECKDHDTGVAFPTCSTNATCENRNGTYNCTCFSGFTGNGSFCREFDECNTTDTPDFELKCAYDATCHDLINDINCTCNQGYTGDGFNICGKPLKARLTGMHSQETRNQGFVEIFPRPIEEASYWRKICDNDWGSNESRVVCEMLGYHGVSFISVSEKLLKHNEEQLEAWLDDLRCTETDMHLLNCTPGIFGSANCLGNTRVNLTCSNTTMHRSETNALYGELYYYNRDKDSDFHFTCSQWEGDRVVKSKETCQIHGRSASIECQTFESDGESEILIDFDYLTFREFNCNTTTDELVLKTQDDEKLADEELGLVPKILGDLSAITENMTVDHSTESNLYGVPGVINTVFESVNKTGSKPKKPSTFYMMWGVANFERAISLANTGSHKNSSAQFTNADKLKFVKSLNGMASLFNLNELNMTVETKTVMLMLKKFGIDNAIVKFEGFHEEGREQVTAAITDPPSQVNVTTSANIYFYKSPTIFPTPIQNNTNISEVVSVEFSRGYNKSKSQNVSLRFPFGRNEAPHEITMPGALYYHECATLDSETGEWITDYCSTTMKYDNVTICECMYVADGSDRSGRSRRGGTAAFSVLVKTYHVEDSLVLGYVGMVGCILSSVSLLLLIVVYSSFKTIRSGQINQIHMHLSACLLVVYVTFLVGIERKSKYIPCMSAAALLQFSLLSSWGWMLVESVTMYKKFIQVFSSTGSKYVMKCALIVYSVAACGTITNATVASQIDKATWPEKDLAFAADIDFRPSIYVSNYFCWLHSYSLYFGFLAPIGVILFLNIFACAFIVKKITTSGSDIRSSATKVDAQQHFMRAMMIAFLLGVPWVVGVPLTLTDVHEVHEVFGWLFTILNSYQGVIMFLLFCVKRKEVRTLVVSRVSSVMNSRAEVSASAVSNINLNPTNVSAAASTNPSSKVHQETAMTAMNAECLSRTKECVQGLNDIND